MIFGYNREVVKRYLIFLFTKQAEYDWWLKKKEVVKIHDARSENS